MPNIDKVRVNNVDYGLGSDSETSPYVNKIRVNNVDYEIGSNSNFPYIDKIRINGIDYDIGLPYTELEYIESTGTQYIDTGFKPTNTSGFKTIIGIAENVGDDHIFGARDSNGRFTAIQTNLLTYVGFNATNNPRAIRNSNLPTGPITFENNYLNQRKMSVYGEGIASNSFQGLSFNDTLSNMNISVYIAGAYNNGNPIYHKYRQYETILTNGNEIVGDFIPVKRKSDNVICMYDKITETFYTNSGSGTYIAGPEKPKPNTQRQYIESNGNQYIDTGIEFSTDLVIDMQVEYVKTTTDYQFMGHSAVRGAHFGITSTGIFTLEGNITSSLSPFQKRHLIHTIFQGGNSLNIDGTIITRNEQNIPSTSEKYKLFSSENKISYCKIYECKIYKSNVLVRDFVPYVDENSNACMYDKVSETFFYNEGAGSFIAGPEI